jgi:putative membrane protein
MRSIIVAARSIIIAATLVSFGGQAIAASSRPADSKFLTQAAACNHADAKLGQLAIERGVDPQVKALGRKMIDDQAAMNVELTQLAEEKKIALPKKMDDKDKKLYRNLQGFSGDSFDREFLKAISERQKRAIDAFQLEAGTGRDPDVKQFAARNEMMLRAHRDLANDARQHL